MAGVRNRRARSKVDCQRRPTPVLPQCLSTVYLIQFLRLHLDGGASSKSVLEIRLNLFGERPHQHWTHGD